MWLLSSMSCCLQMLTINVVFISALLKCETNSCKRPITELVNWTIKHPNYLFMYHSSCNHKTQQVVAGSDTTVTGPFHEQTATGLSVSGLTATSIFHDDLGYVRAHTHTHTCCLCQTRTGPEKHFSPSYRPPQYKTITLARGPDGLGFSIVGGFGSPHGDLPIYVKTVFGKVGEISSFC